jgi:hypothetical protein
VANYRHRARLGPRYDWVPAFSERRWIADRTAYEDLVRLAAHDWGAAWRDDSWGPVEDGFRRMLRLGEQYGFRVVAAVFPVRVQVESRVADDRPQQRFRQLADRLGIPALDLLPVLTSANAPSFYDHCHLTPNGNAAVAGALADFLASRTTPSGVR